MRKDLERATIATDEQPELEPGTRVTFKQGHLPTPDKILTGTIIAPDKQWKSIMSHQFVLIRPDVEYIENGWPKEVKRKKSEVRVI